MEYPTDAPRKYAREAIEKSVDSELWKKNVAFTDRLIEKSHAHYMSNHPIISAMANNAFSLEAIKVVHLEFRAAFAQIFTDALIRLMETSSQLEPALGAKAKDASRFLVQMNVVEELGFSPSDNGTSFCGHPGYAHYWQFAETLTALGAPEHTWKDYVPAPESLDTRESLEVNYEDHLRLALVLAVIETVFIHYAGPWAKNTLYVCGQDISDGYHSIHTEDDDGNFIDDDHAEDSWYIVRQALTEDRYEELERLTEDTLDIWVRFVDMLMEKHHAIDKTSN